MLEILGSLLTIESLDVFGLLAYVGWRRRIERQNTLLFPRDAPRRLWLIDRELRSRIGPATKFQKQAAARLVQTVRWVTHTRAFEHLVAGLMNPKSRWHHKKPSMNPSVRTFL